MGHHSLIALVTATIHELISAGLGDGAAGAMIRIGSPPAQASDDVLASLCLHRLSPLSQLRNDDLPTRQANGRAAKPPRVAIALHYLLSFDGRDALAAQIMLGRSVSILHAVPVLTADRVARVLGQTELHPALRGISPPDPWLPVSLVAEYPAADDLWRLWRAFRADPRPSLHYVASPILIDAEIGAEEAKRISSVGISVGR